MKICPFCAEEIQDAAIVCKHCHRDLAPQLATTPPPKTTTTGFWSNTLLGFVVVVVLLTVAGLLQRGSTEGKCVLHARAAVITKDTPLGQLMHWTTDVLAIRNLDRSNWDDLEVNIYGSWKTGTNTTNSGVHLAKKRVALAGELTAFNVYEFRKPSGEGWDPFRMTIEGVGLRAMINGESCSTATDIRPTSTGAGL